MNANNEHLIYGKSAIQSIVGLEVNDEHAEVFQQRQDGTVSSIFVGNKFWILSNENIDGNFVELEGGLHYRFGKQFKSKSTFRKMKSIWGRGYDIYCINNSEESLMVKDGYSFFQGLKHNDVSILSFDIETNGVKLNADSQVVLISNTFRDSQGTVTRKLFCWNEYPAHGQALMIEDWCEWVKKMNPSIMCGHNILGFDFPFLEYCGGNLSLGRNGSDLYFDNWESKYRKDGSQFIHYKKAHIYGRTLIDTMFLAIKYDVGRKYESYGLKAIIKHEGLERTDRQFYDAATIRDNYKNPEEMVKIKAYAEHDADDALALYDLMSAPFFYLAQSISKTYQEVMLGATGSWINNVMMRAYLQERHSLPKATEVEHFEGGISFGEMGLYENVHKVDVASLYPSIIIEYAVCDLKKDPHGYFLHLVKVFTEKRFEYKKKAKEDKYYDDLQGAYKIFINSCYGFLGTSGLLFNCPTGAAFVTAKGREILEKAIDWAKNQGYNIVNADTDSISYSGHTDQLQSEEIRKSNLANLNSLYPTRIKFEDDGFFQMVIVLAAKNYALWDGKKLKLKGSALLDSKKEIALKDYQKEVIWAMVKKQSHEDIKNIYFKYVQEAINGITDIKRWCSKKTLTEAIYTSPRKNETKVLDAIKGTEYKEADKVWVYFRPDGTLALMEHFDGNYDRFRMCEKLFNASDIFIGVLPKELFINYKLKKNQKLLDTNQPSML